MSAGKHTIEAPPVVMPRRSLSRIACGMAAAFGLAAGVVIGLAIGSPSESRQWIDAERDRLAQEAASLARWKSDLDALQREWEPFRAKRNELTEELASARRDKDEAVDRETKLREELARTIATRDKLRDVLDSQVVAPSDSAAKSKAGTWKRLAQWVVKSQEREGTKSSEPFVTTGDTWRVSWRTDHPAYLRFGFVAITVRDKAGSLVSETSGWGNGSFLVQRGPGSYYVDVTAIGARAIITIEEPY